MGTRLSLRLMNSIYWKSRFPPRVLRQRKYAYFESLRPLLVRRANDNMNNYRRLMSMRRLGPRSLTCLMQSKTHEHKTHESTRSQQSTRGVSNAAPRQHRQRSLHPRLLRSLCVTLHWYVRRGE